MPLEYFSDRFLRPFSSIIDQLLPKVDNQPLARLPFRDSPAFSYSYASSFEKISSSHYHVACFATFVPYLFLFNGDIHGEKLASPV